VRGELVGGCDIVTEMHATGELADLLGVDDDGAGEEQPAAETVEAPPLSIENRLG
jgi:hypothetical protein